MAFVNGYIDDPFGMTDLSGLPVANNPLHGVVPPDGNAAQPTNWLYNDAFTHVAPPQTGGDLQWNTTFASVDTKQEGGGGGEWWDALAPRDQSFMDAPSAYNANARNATYNLVMAQLERSGVDYEFALANGLIPTDFAHGGGEPIHMPQPRQPPPDALLNNDFALDRQAYHLHASADPSRQPQHRAAQSGHLDQSAATTAAAISTPAAGAPTFRRPQPRAPSTGARYHHAGSLTSPRKVRDRSTSSSSPSPTQSTARTSRATSRAVGGRPQRRSASNHAGPSSTSSLSSAASTSSSASSAPTAKLAPPHAIRKQKSWSHNRRSSGAMAMSVMTSKSRVPSASSSASEPQLQQQNNRPPATPDRRRSSDGGGIGFVNFTPNDHDFLMTGVAPSGSSKTKARREKEAIDRQRRLNEAVMRVVADSGVDVTTLKELTWGV